MDIILIPLLSLFNAILGIYTWIIIASVISSWLINFNVINIHNPVVRMILEFLYKATEPILGKIRRFLPILGGIDLSPLALIFFLWFIQGIIRQLMIRIAIGTGV